MRRAFPVGAAVTSSRHLARNADGVRGMVEGAIAGEEREQYPHGAEGRAADIDAGARPRPAER